MCCPGPVKTLFGSNHKRTTQSPFKSLEVLGSRWMSQSIGLRNSLSISALFSSGFGQGGAAVTRHMASSISIKFCTRPLPALVMNGAVCGANYLLIPSEALTKQLVTRQLLDGRPRLRGPSFKTSHLRLKMPCELEAGCSPFPVHLRLITGACMTGANLIIPL